MTLEAFRKLENKLKTNQLGQLPIWLKKEFLDNREDALQLTDIEMHMLAYELWSIDKETIYNTIKQIIEDIK